MNTYQFKTNINCGGCVAAVKPHLEKEPAIVSWNVDTASKDKLLTVATALDAAAVKNIVIQAGFKAELQ